MIDIKEARETISAVPEKNLKAWEKTRLNGNSILGMLQEYESIERVLRRFSIGQFIYFLIFFFCAVGTIISFVTHASRLYIFCGAFISLLFLGLMFFCMWGVQRIKTWDASKEDKFERHIEELRRFNTSYADYDTAKKELITCAKAEIVVRKRAKEARFKDDVGNDELLLLLINNVETKKEFDTLFKFLVLFGHFEKSEEQDIFAEARKQDPRYEEA